MNAPLHEISIPVSAAADAIELKIAMIKEAKRASANARFFRERGRADIARACMLTAAVFRRAAINANNAKRVLIEAGYF